MSLVSNLAEYIKEFRKAKPIVVAFDGVDTSGKTTLADKIYDIIKNKGENVLRVSIDKFHNPRDYRLRRGPLSPEGFFYDSFNIDKIIECVLYPIKKSKGFIINGIFDYKTEKQTEIHKTPVSNDLIVLFDGIFLNRDELANFWDLSIFLDISFETVLKRAIERDKEYFGSVEEVKLRYLKRYIPGQKLYPSSCSPKDRAQFVIDNNDYGNPKLMKGSLK